MKEQEFGPIQFIPGCKGGRYPNCHSVFIQGANVLIDPGADRRRLKALRQEKKIYQVWLTHWHEDHIMNLDLFEDVPLYTSKAAAEPLKNIEAFMDAYGVPEGLKTLWKPVMEDNFHFKPRQPAGYLESYRGIELDPVTVDIIETPGHAAGHLSFLFREPDVLLLGDYDLSSFGPWYGDVGSSIEETMASIAYLKEIGAGTCLASHEQGIFLHPEKEWEEYSGIIDKREEKIWELLSSPQTIDTLVDSWIIYGKPKEPLEFYQFGERAHIIKHLDRMVAKGEVISDGVNFQKS